MNSGKKVLFDDCAEEWLTAIETDGFRTQSTCIKYRYIYKTHIMSVFEDIYINEIDMTILNRLKTSIVHLSPSIQSSIKNVINQILEYISINYGMADIKFDFYVKKIHRPVKTLSKSELQKLILFLKSDSDIYKVGILLCLTTGLRLGEICALKWDDFDFDNRTLMVRRTVQRIYDNNVGKTVLLETEPKSYYSKREIPISDKMMLHLSYYYKSGYFFLSDRPLEPKTYQNKFSLYLREADIPHVNFHVLRHTFATNCIECGLDPKSLSEILGHADVRITLNRYVHPTMQRKREYMNKVVLYFAD